MALTPKLTESLLARGYSRRQISRIALGASAAIPFFSEFALAQQAEQQATAPGGRRGGRTRGPLGQRKGGSGPHHLEREPDGAL